MENPHPRSDPGQPAQPDVSAEDGDVSAEEASTYDREGEAQWEREREAKRRARGDRKERVLHTRISERLSDDIRSLAEDLRVPVSNLVRNVLEEAFNAMEEVSEDVGEILDDVMDQAEKTAERFKRRQGRSRQRHSAEPARPAHPIRPTAPAEAPSPGVDLSQVVAWQPVILNVSQRCASTGRDIGVGEDAYMGLGAGGFTGLYLSKEGLEQLR